MKHFRVWPTTFVYLGQFLKHFPFPTLRGLLALSVSMKYKAQRKVSTVCKLHSGFPLVPSCPILILYISPMLLRTTWMECKGEKVTKMVFFFFNESYPNVLDPFQTECTLHLLLMAEQLLQGLADTIQKPVYGTHRCRMRKKKCPMQKERRWKDGTKSMPFSLISTHFPLNQPFCLPMAERQHWILRRKQEFSPIKVKCIEVLQVYRKHLWVQNSYLLLKSSSTPPWKCRCHRSRKINSPIHKYMHSIRFWLGELALRFL